MQIAVTGAAGRLGGQVVRLLAARGHDVVAVVRRPTAFDATAAAVRVRYADYADVTALTQALTGVHVLVLVSSDGEAAKVLLHHENLVQAGVKADVAHVVALSGLHADLESPFCYAVINRHTEDLIVASPCAYSVVAASIFTEFFPAWLVRARTTGEIRVPAGPGKISLVSRSDVGRCLAVAASSPPTGRRHLVTGPESLDLDDMARVAAETWRTPVRYVDVAPAQFAAELLQDGVGPWWMYAYAGMFESVRDQHWAETATDVERLCQRPPIPLREVLSG
jgi:NAD(P)H dehydrogenase (quinone)